MIKPEDLNLAKMLIDAGGMGLLIVVVLLFLNFLRGQTKLANEERQATLKFIQELREGSDKAVLKAAEVTAAEIARSSKESAGPYIQVAEAVKGLASEIRQLKEQHIAHAAEQTTALTQMANARNRRVEDVISQLKEQEKTK